MALSIPKVVCICGAISCALAAILVFASGWAWWWKSEAPPGAGISPPTNAGPHAEVWSYAIGLWTMEVELRTDEQDGSLTYSEDRNFWLKSCADNSKKLFNEVPEWCGRMYILRAGCFITGAFALIATVTFIYSMLKQILLLLLAGFFATLSSIFALLTMGLCVQKRSADIDLGPLLIIVSVGLTGFAVMGSIYGSALAADEVEESLKAEREVGSRQQRAEDARKAAEDEFYMLQNDQASFIEKVAEDDLLGTEAADEVQPQQTPKSEQKQPPKVLSMVLKFLQDHEDDEDAEVDVNLLKLAYREIDEDCSNSIEMSELVEAFRLCGLNISDSTADLIMSEIDLDNDGSISIIEFVKYFKLVEEMNRLQKKKARNAQFMTFVVNCCFLSDILVVAVLVMVVINMERDGGGSEDDKVIVTNLLYASGLVLIVLFCLVIAWPALRLTIQPSLTAWEHFYAAEVQKKRQKKRHDAIEKEKANQSKPSLRHSAISDAGEVAPVEVNAVVMGASYRVTQVQSILDQSRESREGLAHLHHQERAQTHASAASSRRQSKHSRHSRHSGGMPNAIMDGEVEDGLRQLEDMHQPGQVVHEDEDLHATMQRYSGARNLYRGFREPKSFQPYQLQKSEIIKRDAEELAHRDKRFTALTDGSYTFEESRR